MALKALLPSIDELPDNIKSEYVPVTDGEGFRLDVEAVDGIMLENVGTLKDEIRDVKRERDNLDMKLKGFKGVDPDEAKAAIKKVKDFGNMTPDDKEKWEEKEKQLVEKSDNEKAAIQVVADGYLSQLKSQLIDNAARTALGNHKLKEGAEKVLMLEIRNRTQLASEDDGKTFVARVLGDDGKELITKKAGTDYMGIPEFVDGLKEESGFALLFDGSGASGSQTPKGHTPQHTPGGSTPSVDGDGGVITDVTGTFDKVFEQTTQQ